MIAWPSKDPAEVLPNDINWAPRLGSDTITSSTWTIVSGGVSLAINSNSFTTQRTQIWLSNGVIGENYTLKNTVVTAAGTTEIETVSLPIRGR